MRCRSRRLIALPLAALVLGLAIPATPSGAASDDDRRNQLQHAIEEAGQEEAAALQQLQQLQARKAEVDAKVQSLDRQLSEAERRLEPLEDEANRLAAEYTAVLAKLQEAQARLDRAQERLNESAAGLYRSERSGASYDSILSQRPDTVVSQKAYLDDVSASRRRIVKRVTTLRDDVEEKREKVEARKAEVDAATAEARALRDQIAKLRADLEPARIEATAAAKAEQEQLYYIRSNKSKYEREYAALQATSDAIGASLRTRGGPVTAGQPCGSRPVPGAIGSGFGYRTHPITGSRRMHTGVDMHASSGEPIHSCRAGVVVSAGWNGGYGNAVVIDHGDGMATLYAHQSRIAAHVGQLIHTGEVLGYVGSTGMSTGPHLHFEVRIGGNPVDPVPYL
jgi:murein DD-endopeptidase MepM/ murein hydrolase activator NlpD